MNFLNQRVGRLLRVGLLLALGSIPEAMAQDSIRTRFWQRFHPDTLVNRELHVIPVPVLRVSPETGLQYGITLDYLFNSDASDSASTTRNSIAWVQATYSTRKQLMIEPVWQVYTRDERYFLRGRGGYLAFSEYFWGIGNQTLANEAYENLSYNRTYFQGEFLKKVNGRFFTGLTLYLNDTRAIRFGDIERLTGAEEYTGLDPHALVGIGPSLVFDHRNDVFSPTEGWYAAWAYRRHFPSLGSSFTYGEHQLDLRKYFYWNKKHFLGFQGIGQFTDGEVPFRELPRLGGPNIMRGYFMGRFRDRQLWSTQAEYRYNIGRFLLGAAFVSAGGVAPTVSDFSLNTTRLAYGGGVRILVNRKMNLYTRLDYAFTSDRTSGFYFRIMDAF